MQSYGRNTYTYDLNGNLTSKTDASGTTYYNYDNLGNLVSVELSNGTDIEYLIDGQNRRVGKKVDGVLQKQWIYQDQLNPVAEFDGAGNLVSRFVYGDKGHVPSYMEKGGEVYRIITDHLGSVRLVVNISTGQIMQEISYDEFGNVLSNTNPSFQPFAYAGGLYDEATGLVRFGARDYDAEVGRWTAKDPIGFGSRVSNFYEYVLNNPLNYTDIFGLQIYIPRSPVNYPLSENVKIAQRHRIRVYLPPIINLYNMAWFINKVKPGGDWDIKRIEDNLTNQCDLTGFSYEDYGNFHYGVVGKAMGIPDEILLKSAGAIQEFWNTEAYREDFGHFWDSTGSYGDDPNDQFWIRQGINYYNEYYK